MSGPAAGEGAAGWERGGKGLVLVLLFCLLTTLPFLNKAFQLDEPLYIETALHLPRDPLRPGLFAYNWYGVETTMARTNTNPPLLSYLLWPVLAATGGREFPTRFAFLPFDLAAAAFLYLLASRFLARPLWPALVVLAGPAYLVNMPHLMPEKLVMAFGAGGLCALLAALEKKDRRREALAAALFALAGLAKYSGLFFLAPAMALARNSGWRPGRLALFALASCLPTAACLLWQHAAGLGGLGPAAELLGWSALHDNWPLKLRALLAFVGGCGVAAMAWAVAAFPGRRGLLLVPAALGIVPCLPWFDAKPVLWTDRLTAVAFCCGGAASLLAVFLKDGAGGTAEGSQARALWVSWTAAGLALQIAYWGVLGRVVLFVIPPVVFALAARLEARLAPARLRAAFAASLGLTLALGLGAGFVDMIHANGQRQFAAEVVVPAVRAGRRVFYKGHWGLQYYMARAGGTQVDESAGGFNAMRPGDLVLFTRVNPNNSLFGSPNLSRDHVIRELFRVQAQSRIPMRLLSGWAGQGGFHSDSWGFLPYSFSLEPVDEFALGEHL